MKSYNKDIASNDKVEMIHISRDTNEKEALKWAKKEKFPWPTISMKNSSREKFLMSYYGGGVPTYVLVDRDGKKLASGKAAIWAKLSAL